MNHYMQNFAIHYRRIFHAIQDNENVFCVATKNENDYRSRFLEDHFHVLLENASKISTLLQRGKYLHYCSEVYILNVFCTS